VGKYLFFPDLFPGRVQSFALQQGTIVFFDKDLVPGQFSCAPPMILIRQQARHVVDKRIFIEN
jgi:hypothetical protein